MPEPPRRKRFQIHLSTAIVLMFVAGGLIWFQATPRTETLQGRNFTIYGWKVYGWPLFTFERSSPGIVDGEISFVQMTVSDLDVNAAFFQNWKFSIGAALIDGVLCIIVIGIVWFLCEHLIRPRTPQKEP